MNYSTLQLAFDSGIATLTLNRPDKRNAISYDLIGDLLRALDEVKNSSARVLILTGAGKAFSSGLDLDNLKALIGRTPEQSLEDSRTMVSLFRTLYEFPKPTIAAVNGAAIAGGTGLALLCDFTLAVPEAKFGYTEVRIGFVPAIVSTFLLRQVGEKIARDLLLTGRIFDAAEALRIGLLNEIVPPEKLMDRARETGRAVDGEQPAVARLHQAAAHRSRPGGTRRANRGRHPRKRRHPHHRRLPRGHRVISGEAQAGMDGQMSGQTTSRSVNVKPAVNETRIRVRYAETDQMGIVYHSNHFIWFEVGRVELMRQLGFTYKEMEREDGCFIAVVDARCRYKAPVLYDDEVVVRTWLKNVRDKLIHFGYELLRAGSGELLAEGETTHIVADANMKPRSLPEKYRKAFRAAAGTKMLE